MPTIGNLGVLFHRSMSRYHSNKEIEEYMKYTWLLLLLFAAGCILKTNRNACIDSYRSADYICAVPEQRKRDIGRTIGFYLAADGLTVMQNYYLLRCLQGLHLADKCERDPYADWPTIDAKM